MTPYAHGDPSAVVRAILAQRAYRHGPVVSTKQPRPSLFELFGGWFHDHVWEPLRQWLGIRVHDAHAVPGTAGSIVVYGVVALACLVLAYAVYRLAVAFARPGTAASPGARGVALAAARSSREWRALAAEYARAADYGRAIAALFAAATAALDERTIVAFDAARTPGEYRQLVRRSRRAAAEPFNDLCGRFVRVAYAETAATIEDYAAAERAFATFEPALA